MLTLVLRRRGLLSSESSVPSQVFLAGIVLDSRTTAEQRRLQEVYTQQRRQVFLVCVCRSYTYFNCLDCEKSYTMPTLSSESMTVPARGWTCAVLHRAGFKPPPTSITGQAEPLKATAGFPLLLQGHDFESIESSWWWVSRLPAPRLHAKFSARMLPLPAQPACSWTSPRTTAVDTQDSMPQMLPDVRQPGRMSQMRGKL